MSEAAALVDALLGPEPLAALRALALDDPALREVRELAVRRLTTAPPSAGALVLLRAVSRFPGLSRAELAERTGLDAPALADAARDLLDRGLVTSQRFGRTDCWSRTAAGAALLRSDPA